MSTAAASPAGLARRSARRRRTSAELRALARIEGRLLLCHPVFLIGLALSVLVVTVNTSDGGDADGVLQVSMLSGFALLPLAGGTLLAANLAALRSRRDKTDELYGSLPRPREARVAGQLLGLAWTLPISGALIATAYVAFGTPDGFVVNHLGDRHTPEMIQIAQGPAMVVALGALGILLARAAPSPVVAPLTIVTIYLAEVQISVWDTAQTWGAWIVPLSNDVLIRPGAAVPCETGNSVADCQLVLGYDLPAMTWHVSYLVAMTLLVAAAALVRPRRRLALATIAMLATALALTTQLAAG